MTESYQTLIVDDDESIRALVAEGLQVTDDRFAPITCGSLDEARQAMAASHAPLDLLITDYSLPDGSGLEVIAECRRLHPRAPIILITAFGRPELKLEALRAGASAYVTKPFNLDALAEMALALMGGRGGPWPENLGRGALRGVELTDLIQVFCMKGLDRTIRVYHGGEIGSVYIRRGFVRHVDLGKRSGLPALGQMLTWRTPALEALEGCLTGQNTIAPAPTPFLLLEAARLIDETARGEDISTEPGSKAEEPQPAAPKTPDTGDLRPGELTLPDRPKTPALEPEKREALARIFDQIQDELSEARCVELLDVATGSCVYFSGERNGDTHPPYGPLLSRLFHNESDRMNHWRLGRIKRAILLGEHGALLALLTPGGRYTLAVHCTADPPQAHALMVLYIALQRIEAEI